MNKKVSIIIPCFNGERFIDRCLHSIEIQNYPHIEVVVVNDGSIDQSESKILEWKEVLENKKISLIYIKQKNQGIGSAINTGLKYISGEYLLLLDIDDEYLQGALLERVQFLESHREMDVVRSNGWYVRKNGKSLFIYDECEKNIQDVFTALLEGKTNNWAGSYMVRVSSLFKFYPEREIYQSKYGQNLQLLLPLLYNKKCGFIDKPHMNYNQQENSLTKTNVEKSKKKKSLDNANGFRDIREHMVQIIIHDEREREYYLDIIQNFYWRSVMQIAGVYNDDILMKEAFLKLKINKNQPIILEGIHGLNPLLTSSIPNKDKFKIYLSVLTQLNLDEHNRIPTTDLRLIRRIVRDNQFRGHDATRTILSWDSVRRGEKENIFPYQEEADVIFNSSCVYELAILKSYVKPLLESINSDSEAYSEANRLLKFLQYFVELRDISDLPPTSIIREFIGGSKIVD